MRVLLVYTHHRRCIAHWYRRAFAQLGHQVASIGPWADDYPFGVHGMEPTHGKQVPMRWPAIFDLAEFEPPEWDMLMLIDQGEHLVVNGINKPWVHLAMEGTGLEHSRAMLRFYGIKQDTTPHGSIFLPGGYDRELYDRNPQGERCYDLVQLATPRAARTYVWKTIQGRGALTTFFGEIWGGAYPAVHHMAIATYACTTQDFVCLRVWEAMAAGCIVLCDRTPTMLSMFRDREHFIGLDTVATSFGEHAPHAFDLEEIVLWVKANHVARISMANAARELVRSRDSWAHRAQTVIDAYSARRRIAWKRQVIPGNR